MTTMEELEFPPETPYTHSGIDELPPDADPAPRSQWQLFWRRFRRHKMAMVGGVTLILLTLSALFAEQIAPYGVNDIDLTNTLQRPSGEHWFGTDELGRDVFSRVIFGGRISLYIGFFVAIGASLLGTFFGAVAGWFGGRTDKAVSRLIDLLLVIPGIAILAMALNAWGGDIRIVVLILAFLGWMQLARVVRSTVLQIREQQYIEAARSSGASNTRIITRHVLPNAIGPIVVATTLAVGIAILTESTLSFLGFGIQTDDTASPVSWGAMLSSAEGWIGTPNAFLLYFPGLFILLTVLAVNFLGDGLRDALDPHSGHNT
jgi:peptide/nickel transport system permease protein